MSRSVNDITVMGHDQTRRTRRYMQLKGKATLVKNVPKMKDIDKPFIFYAKKKQKKKKLKLHKE